MSESSSSRNDNDNDNIDSFGVTEYKSSVFTFRWNIKNFKHRLRREDAELFSPVFISPSCGEPRPLRWKLAVQWGKQQKDPISPERRYLSAYLYLVNCRKPTKVSYQLDLLDYQGNLRKTAKTTYTFTSSTTGFGFPTYVRIANLHFPPNHLLDDNTLKLRCQIKKIWDTTQLLPSPQEQAAAIRKNYIISDYAELFNNPNQSDVSIKTISNTLRAHKAVLSCRSSVFSAMFQSEMSESVNHIVEILDFEHDVVNAMLKYIYCGEIPGGILSKYCQAVLQISDKYFITGLKEEAEEFIAGNLSLENVTDSLILADMYNASNLKKRAIRFFNINKTKLLDTGASQKILNYNPSLLIELYRAC